MRGMDHTAGLVLLLSVFVIYVVVTSRKTASSGAEKETSRMRYRLRYEPKVLLTPSSSGEKEAGDQMKYWHPERYPEDLEFVSSISKVREKEKSLGRRRFLAFQWDIGGFNNIRLSLEIMVTLSLVTNRTLILPPRKKVYLLDQRKRHGVIDFYDYEDLSKRFDVMDTSEFLSLARDQEHFKKPSSDLREEDADRVYAYFREVAYLPHWDPYDSIFVVPRHFTGLGIHIRNSANKELNHYLTTEKRQIIQYDVKMDQHDILFLPVHVEYDKENGVRERYLLPFYTFVVSDYEPLDSFLKRSIRDYLHYNQEIMDLSGYIVNDLGQDYVAMHVRRGDFQFEQTLMSKEVLLQNVREFLHVESTVLYIATDEKDLSYFEEFRPLVRRLVFLSEYLPEFPSFPSSYLGHVEQMVCAKASIFIGTYWSTFTAFIHRMRGYYGFDSSTSYYTMKENKYALHMPSYPIQPYWFREFDAGWQGIETRFTQEDLTDFAFYRQKLGGRKEGGKEERNRDE